MELVEVVRDFIYNRTGVNAVFSQGEFEGFLNDIRSNRKVDAIKNLRSMSRVSLPAHVSNTASGDNAFFKFVVNNNIQINSNTVLGLKDAKDVVDFIAENGLAK